MGLSENVGYIPNEIAIFHRDNDQQNQWVNRGTNHFQTHPNHLQNLYSYIFPYINYIFFQTSKMSSRSAETKPMLQARFACSCVVKFLHKK